MGAADLVPGISGGSMALILGIYEDLIYALKSLASTKTFSLFSFDFHRFSRFVSWDFLTALLMGVALSFAAFSQVIHFVLEDEYYRVLLYASFIGMILATALHCARQISRWDGRALALCLAGGVISFAATGMEGGNEAQGELYAVSIAYEAVVNPADKVLLNYDEDEERLTGVSENELSAMLARGGLERDTAVYRQSDGAKFAVAEIARPIEQGLLQPWLIVCGGVAICAMLLPGISGSYLLNILGVYPLAIAALAEFTRTLDFEAFVFLANLGIGIVCGALLFSSVIAWLLSRYHAETLATLIGFMIGALRTVWPFHLYHYKINPLKLGKGPELLVGQPYIPQVDDPLLWGAVGCVMIGVLAVLCLERIAGQGHKKG